MKCSLDYSENIHCFPVGWVKSNVCDSTLCFYTTNVIESFNALLRKFTKNKKVFPHDDVVLKSVWLSVQQISKKWTMKIRDWGLIVNQLTILFPNRIKL